MKRILITILMLLCFTGQGWAVTTYYVRSTGDGSDGSTEAKAYQTIQACLDAVDFGAGDICNLGAETYREELTLAAADGGITFQGQGTSTVITSMEVIAPAGWTQVGATEIYATAANYPTEPEGLSVDGDVARRAFDEGWQMTVAFTDDASPIAAGDRVNMYDNAGADTGYYCNVYFRSGTTLALNNWYCDGNAACGGVAGAVDFWKFDIYSKILSSGSKTIWKKNGALLNLATYASGKTASAWSTSGTPSYATQQAPPDGYYGWEGTADKIYWNPPGATTPASYVTEVTTRGSCLNTWVATGYVTMTKSTTSRFTITNPNTDQTAALPVNKIIRINGSVFAVVTASSFAAATTTVDIKPAAVPVTITSLDTNPNVDGITINDVTFIGSKDSDTASVDFTGCANVTLNRVIVRGPGVWGCRVQECTPFAATDCTFEKFSGYDIVVRGLSVATLTRCNSQYAGYHAGNKGTSDKENVVVKSLVGDKGIPTTTFNDCKFRYAGNETELDQGLGLYLGYGTITSTTLNRCEIYGNRVSGAKAILGNTAGYAVGSGVQGTITLNNCLFHDNGLYPGGRSSNTARSHITFNAESVNTNGAGEGQATSTLVIYNCTFANGYWGYDVPNTVFSGQNVSGSVLTDVQNAHTLTLTMKNNIFGPNTHFPLGSSAEVSIYGRATAGEPADYDGHITYTLDNNCYYHATATDNLIYIADPARAAEAYVATAAKFAEYQTEISQDAASMFSDPLLLSGGKLRGGSPCIDAGANSLTTTTFTGSVRPLHGTADIGAYEYNPTLLWSWWR